MKLQLSVFCEACGIAESNFCNVQAEYTVHIYWPSPRLSQIRAQSTEIVQKPSLPQQVERRIFKQPTK